MLPGYLIVAGLVRSVGGNASGALPLSPFRASLPILGPASLLPSPCSDCGLVRLGQLLSSLVPMGLSTARVAMGLSTRVQAGNKVQSAMDSLQR